MWGSYLNVKWWGVFISPFRRKTLVYVGPLALHIPASCTGWIPTFDPHLWLAGEYDVIMEGLEWPVVRLGDGAWRQTGRTRSVFLVGISNCSTDSLGRGWYAWCLFYMSRSISPLHTYMRPVLQLNSAPAFSVGYCVGLIASMRWSFTPLGDNDPVYRHSCELLLSVCVIRGSTHYCAIAPFCVIYGTPNNAYNVLPRQHQNCLPEVNCSLTLAILKKFQNALFSLSKHVV